jgi:Tfp pilus assembly protein PilN
MAKNESFLPDDYLEKRVVRRTNILCLLLFVIVMAGIGAVGYMTYQKQVEVRQKQAKVNERYRKAKKRLEQVEKLQNRKQQMIRKARVTSALVERVPRSTLLAELINHMPTSLSVLDMQVESRVIDTGPQPATAMQKEQIKKDQQKIDVEVKHKQINVDLVGVAPTDVEVSEYMTALGGYRLFSDVNLQYAEQTQINGKKMRKFRLDIKIANDVSMRQLEPTKIARDLKQNPMSDEVQIKSGQLVPVKNQTPKNKATKEQK